ncbi:MAG: hypothetical protein R3F34_09035 [Planctomycetota bacterium]
MSHASNGLARRVEHRAHVYRSRSASAVLGAAIGDEERPLSSCCAPRRTSSSSTATSAPSASIVSAANAVRNVLSTATSAPRACREFRRGGDVGQFLKGLPHRPHIQE